MSDAPPDFGMLARRYLDLWQDQVAAMAADPALAEVLARGIRAMSEGLGAQAPAAEAASNGTASNGTAGDEVAGTEVNREKAAHGASPPDRRPLPAAPPGAAPAAGPDRGARLDDDGLASRLAALEERVAALEARFGGAGRGPAAPTRRRRP